MKKRFVVGIVASMTLLGGVSLLVRHNPTETPISPVSPITSIPRPPAAQPVTSNNSASQTTSQPASSHSAQSSLSTTAPISSPVAKPTEIIASDGTRYPLRTYTTSALPNDPGANQWWVNSTDLPSAWARGYGSYQTTVAIIDTGFALNHEELTGRWATNNGEQGTTSSQATSIRNCTDRGLALNASCNLIDDDLDTIVDNESGSVTVQNPSRLNCTDRGLALNKSCNLLDDDNNGYKDDVSGWDFVNYDASVQAGQTNPSGSSTTHGTMTSGTLGATGNNGVGIAGVNWSTRILPIQAIDDDGYGDTLTLSRSILYAVSRGVDIISLSLGTTQSDPYLRQTIQYATASGVLVIAASGNEGCDCISYPARYPEVLSVGAIDQNNNPASFSNYGASLDILAPGQQMTLPAWSSAHPTNGYVANAAGTSFATPYVAGLLAQLKSFQPTATYAELIGALNETSDQTTLSQTSPWSSTRGFGIAHAGRSTSRITTTASPLVRYQFTPTANSATVLDSTRVYDCQTATHPSTTLYELTNGNTIAYTVSELQRYTATNNGWTSRTLGYQCVGLPNDTPSQTRLINLPQEVSNRLNKN